MKKTTILAVSTALGGLAALLFAEPALASNIGKLAEDMSSQGQGIASLLGTASYLMGAGFGIKGGLKLKEHNEQPQQTKLSSPLTMLAVSGMLFALPTVMDTGADSVFGANSKKAGSKKNLTVE
jgi:hypothetical protein